MTFQTVLLQAKHNRRDFACGKETLDSYLYFQVNQDIKRKLAACFVLEGTNSNSIKGYYTLSSNNIPKNDFPETICKKLPPAYPFIPTTLLGRLAVDSKFQGEGAGRILLVDALFRSYETSKTVGSFGVVVDPLDEAAGEFYSKYGFLHLPDSKKMFLPMKTIEQLFL